MPEPIFPEKAALKEAVRLSCGFGRQVAIVLHQRARNVWPLFEATLSLTQPVLVSEIRKTNGLESISFRGGGRISFVAPPHRIRGYAVDVLVLSDELSEEHRKSVLPAVATSKNKQVLSLGDLKNRP